MKLKLIVQKIFVRAKIFFGIPLFFDYAMADGIFEILKKARNGIVNLAGKTEKNADDFQLSLFPQ